MAVAVGLTPEMLPMIVTVCLSKGAVAMGKKKVIVKRLNAIQNLGAMDVLCTDKTGTLTMDKVILETPLRRHAAARDDDVLALAYINSHFQTGLKNVLDRAVLAHEETHAHARDPGAREGRRDPVRLRAPDHVGRRSNARGQGPHHLQGRARGDLLAVRELPGSTGKRAADGPPATSTSCKEEYERLSADGFRVLAIATKQSPPRGASPGNATPYGKADECDLILEGYVAFLDPPKETCAAAIAALQSHGVTVKVITGDNELVSRKVCTGGRARGRRRAARRRRRDA